MHFLEAESCIMLRPEVASYGATARFADVGDGSNLAQVLQTGGQ